MSTVPVRNDFREARVVPELGWALVPAGGILPVEAENAYHWAAGGWSVLERYPVPHHLYPNHQGDPIAYSLPAPEPEPLGAPASAPAGPLPGAEDHPAEPAPAGAEIAATLPAEENAQ